MVIANRISKSLISVRKMKNQAVIIFAMVALCRSSDIKQYEEIQVDAVRSCGSATDSWKCCLSIEAYSMTACVGVKVLREDIGLRSNITYNDVVIFQNEISVVHPPNICAKVPYTKDFAEACVKFYDMEIDHQHKRLSGCARFYAELLDCKLLNVTIGCFDFPISRHEIKALERKNFDRQIKLIL